MRSPTGRAVSHLGARKLIVIEGLDGSGKSSVARRLCDMSGAKLFHTPPAGFAATRKSIDRDADLGTRFLFYLCSVAFTSKKMQATLQKRNAVCDRYIASTVAYHRALGLDLSWDLKQLELVTPAHTFFLNVNDDAVRLQRLQKRGLITSSDRLLDDKALRQRVVSEFRKFPMEEIDTTNLTIDEIVKLIRASAGI